MSVNSICSGVPLYLNLNKEGVNFIVFCLVNLQDKSFVVAFKSDNSVNCSDADLQPIIDAYFNETFQQQDDISFELPLNVLDQAVILTENAHADLKSKRNIAL